ncbi:MAG: flagellar motor protein MotB [Nitrospirae bacterium]|nr:flagellar motor protein MotB [Nitrospirota bacterium]
MTLLLLLLVGAFLWPPSALPAAPGVESVRFGKAAFAFSAGFIRKDIPVDGNVSLTTGTQSTGDNRRLLGTGDQLFMKMFNPDEVSPGDAYTLYRVVHKVFHPASGSYLGNLIQVVAIVSVVKMNQDLATVRVVRAYDSVVPGDTAMRFVPPPDEETVAVGRMLPSSPGMIVDLPPQRTLIGQRNVVYIDWGREDGLLVGDQLEVFRVASGLPMRVIGELQVIALEDNTATAVITRSTATLIRGDRFIFKETPHPQAEEHVKAAEAEAPPVAKPSTEMTQTQEAASAVANIGLQQDGVRLLASLASQLQYEPGQVEVKPEDQNVLKQIGDILKNVTDKEIRIEGHADDMPIGPSLKPQFATNKELSKARAVNVVRYLVEEGGVDAANLSAVEYADTRPIASNKSEEGRKRNRRIEIVLLPKEPSESAQGKTTSRADSGNTPLPLAPGEGPASAP